ncbi:MAG TPA: hypothetical protein VGL71_13245 [Urbifossiella sp.]|jgi:hypothetical protein
MRVHEALEQLDAIHEHLARAEVYRGFKVPGVALVGFVGIAAAASQSRILGNPEPALFIAYWLIVAAIGAMLGFSATAQAYFIREEEFARRKTRRVLAQFLPCVAAGGLMTAAVVRNSPEFTSFLPPLWAIVFGLGMISARPYLPRGIGIVGLGYVLAGGLLVLRSPDAELSGWSVGGVFGAGHLLTALVLWCDRPRESDA